MGSAHAVDEAAIITTAAARESTRRWRLKIRGMLGTPTVFDY
jgi:hypothetical protein